MTHILLDTWPLVAFLNRKDRFHEWVSEILGSLRPPLLTCDSVLSEACFLLRKVAGGPEAVLTLVRRQIVLRTFSLESEIDAVSRLMRKYADVPMDLADACLVRMSELHRESTVLTLDGDFRIYRRYRNAEIPLISPDLL